MDTKKRCAEQQIQDVDRRLIEQVTAYLDTHYAEEVPLPQLAKMACMGLTKFKISFRVVHGCTVTEYARQKRMRRATQLLLGTGIAVGQVAKQVGYHSASRFAQLFYLQNGLRPLQYRQTHGGWPPRL